MADVKTIRATVREASRDMIVPLETLDKALMLIVEEDAGLESTDEFHETYGQLLYDIGNLHRELAEIRGRAIQIGYDGNND